MIREPRDPGDPRDDDRPDRPDRGDEPRGASGRGGKRKRHPALADPNLVIDYKNVQLLRQFITERGKLVPRRISGATAKQQRKLALAVRRARMLALLPFTVTER